MQGNQMSMTETSDTITAPSGRFYQDPNPMLLFGVFSAMLINVAGVLSRYLARQSNTPDQSDDVAAIRRLSVQVNEGQQIQRQHRQLVLNADAGNERAFPVGVRTLFLTYSQVRDYQQIRDRSLELFANTTRETVSINAFPLLPTSTQEQIEIGLKSIQRDLLRSSRTETFGEIASVLGEGFEAARSAMLLLSGARSEDR